VRRSRKLTAAPWRDGFAVGGRPRRRGAASLLARTRLARMVSPHLKPLRSASDFVTDRKRLVRMVTSQPWDGFEKPDSIAEDRTDYCEFRFASF
jgi:hypothetical protein